MKFNEKDRAQWDAIFSNIPDAWTTAQPTEHMQDCLAFFQHHGVKTVFDIGCGIGIWAQFLAKAGIRVCGTDFSEKAIAFAKKWAQQTQIDADFACVSATTPAFPQESFDAVLAAKIIDNLSRAEAQIAMKRIHETFRNRGGVAYFLFSPFLEKSLLEKLSASANPTAGITHTNYTDTEIVDMFGQEHTVKLKKYDDGFRGVFVHYFQAESDLGSR